MNDGSLEAASLESLQNLLDILDYVEPRMLHQLLKWVNREYGWEFANHSDIAIKCIVEKAQAAQSLELKRQRDERRRYYLEKGRERQRQWGAQARRELREKGYRV